MLTNAACLLAFAALTCAACSAAPVAETAKATPGVPYFEFDPTWPKQPLPNHLVLGNITGVYVDDADHIWIGHRPSSLRPDVLEATTKPPKNECCFPPPDVLEFGYDGNFIQGWARPYEGYGWTTPGAPSSDSSNGGFPSGLHSLYVDYKDHVWIGSDGLDGAQILKFTRSGKFLMQIGHRGQSKGSDDTENIKGAAASIVVDPKTNELYVGDGYGNHRIVVFDADTGKYKRHWGAHGKRRDDSYPYKYISWQKPEQSGVWHSIALSNDRLVYACDRSSSRIQVFEPDGTYLEELFLEPKAFNGTAFDIAFSPDPAQTYAYVTDGRNEEVWILQRKPLKILGSFGCQGHWAGCFTTAHSLAVDSKGNLYVGETWEGKRVQRYLYKGLRASNN